jgi:hypothetical protein
MCCVCVPALYTQLRTLAMGLFPSRCALQPPDHCSNSYRGQAQIRSKTGGIRAPPSRNALAPIGLSLCVCVLYQCVFFSLYNRQSQAKM